MQADIVNHTKITLWNNIKNARWYALYFLLLFDIGGIATFTDGDPTTGMFIIVSFLFVTVLLVVYGLTNSIIKIKPTAALKHCIMLYLLSELVFSFVGEFSFFGIFYYLHILKVDYAPDELPFRIVRDVAFSTSCLIAAVLSYIHMKAQGRQTARSEQTCVANGHEE